MKFIRTISESSTFSLIGFLSVSVLVSQSLLADGQGVNFELITGTQKYDDAKCIIQTLDSGYAVVGSTSAFGSGQSDIYLTKISKTGTVTWQQAIGGAGVEHGNAVIQTPDSGFAITGYSNSTGAGGYDVFLAKTDKNGTLQWSNTYGGTDWDFGNSLLMTLSGYYIVCGSTYSYGNGNGDAYLLTIDPTGALLWDFPYGGTLEDAGNSVCETGDGGYMVTGYTKSFGAGNEDIYLLKVDGFGVLQWEKTYGGIAEEKGSEGKLTTDGGFIIISASKSFSPGNKYENWLLKTDALGDTLWTRRDAAAFNRVPTSVCQTADGGYIFTGHDDNVGQYNMFLYKTNSLGLFVDYRNYGGGGTENAFSVKQTFDKGYVVVGVTDSYGNGKPNIYVLKTDSNRISTGTIIVVVSVEENELPSHILALYPNPASEYVIVKAETASMLKIFDATGKNILSGIITRGENTIDVAGLPEGIYFIYIRSENHAISRKIIIRH